MSSSVAHCIRRLAAAAFAVPIVSGFAEDALSQAPSYCSSLQQVVALAAAKDRFASIAGQWREGSFHDTSLPLNGWSDCSLYGLGAYTCDSQPIQSQEQAEKVQARIVDEILSCFAGAWFHIVDRSSPAYAVLHPLKGPASITLSVDETDAKKFVVRLTLFVRRG
jgi:hypothetical protein